jgi:hypothetical protein
MEVDVARDKLGLSQGCPIMTRFWALYGRNGFDERHQYLVKTGFLGTVEKFNKEQRPKYVQCDATVQKELTGPDSAQEYFAQRYATGSEKRILSTKIYTLLTGLREKVPDLYVALGARSPGESKEGAGAGAGAKKASSKTPPHSSTPSHPSGSSKPASNRGGTPLSMTGLGGGSKH